MMYASALTTVSKSADVCYIRGTGPGNTYMIGKPQEVDKTRYRQKTMRDTGGSIDAVTITPANNDDKRTDFSPILPTFDSSVRNCCSSRLLRFSGLSMVGTSWATMGDVVVILRFSSNREDSPRLLSQRDRSHGDLQRWDSTQLDRGPIIRLDAPVEILFEIRRDDTGLERGETRHLREGIVEVYEALGYKVCLFAAIGALVCRAVHERGVGTDERGTGAPLRSIRGNFTEEE